MPWSHHSHSGQYCRHAKGTLQEIVEGALQAGFQLYGLSEHMPRFRQQDLYPEESDLTPAHLQETFAAYVREATQLKSTYAGRLTLLVGLETDVIHQGSLDDLARVLENHRLDYIVGSVHHANGIPIDFDKATFDQALASFKGNREALCNHYFDQQYALIQRCQPEVIGHFDLCRLYHPELDFRTWPSTWAKIARNVEAAVEYGALFEINGAAFRKGWKTAYPGAEVLQLLKDKGALFCLSDDSHGLQAIGLHYRDTRKYLAEQDIAILHYLDIPKGGEQCSIRGRGRTVIRQADDDWQKDTCFEHCNPQT